MDSPASALAEGDWPPTPPRQHEKAHCRLLVRQQGGRRPTDPAPEGDVGGLKGPPCRERQAHRPITEPRPGASKGGGGSQCQPPTYRWDSRVPPSSVERPSPLGRHGGM